MKLAKILFFVDGPSPTPDDFVAAADMKATVVFRNARAVPSEPHSLEKCDGVAGKVPAIYAKAFPSAEKAVAIKTEELKALSQKVGDTPAPKPAAKTETPAAPAAPAKSSAEAPKPAAAAKPEAGKAPAWNPNPAQ